MKTSTFTKKDILESLAIFLIVAGFLLLMAWAGADFSQSNFSRLHSL